MLQQFLEYVGSKRIGALEKLAGFLERLAYADFAENFESSAFRFGDIGLVCPIFERSYEEQTRWGFLEESLAVICDWEAFCEPARQSRDRRPTVETQDWTVRNVLTVTVPIKGSFPNDV